MKIPRLIKHAFGVGPDRIGQYSLFFPLVLTVMVCLPSLAMAASTLNSVNVVPVRVATDQDASISVSGTGNCVFDLYDNEGRHVTERVNFDRSDYRTSFSWDSSGLKTITAVGLGPCSGTAVVTVLVVDSAAQTPGGSEAQPAGAVFGKRPEQRMEPAVLAPKYEAKQGETPKLRLEPKIESATTNPPGGLTPGGKLHLTGSGFGTIPGKIIISGNFHGRDVELEDVRWHGNSQIDGIIPAYLEGRANQKVNIRVLASPTSDNNYSKNWSMDFRGRAYCGENEGQNLIYAAEGSVMKDCSPFRCNSDDGISLYCMSRCYSTGDCAFGYSCGAEGLCAPR